MHDEVKDKEFELELSWVGEGEELFFFLLLMSFARSCPFLRGRVLYQCIMHVGALLCIAVTGGKHQAVPSDIRAEAEQYAKEAIKDSDSEDDD